MFGDDEYGKQMNKMIADNLGGKYNHAITFDELKSSFKEVLNQGFKL